MRTHPELYLPEAKEQPFFTNDAAFEEGWEAFAAVAFHGAPPAAATARSRRTTWADPSPGRPRPTGDGECRDRTADPRAVPGREADRDAPRPGRARDLELLADGGAGRRRALARRALDEELSAEALEAARAGPPMATSTSSPASTGGSSTTTCGFPPRAALRRLHGRPGQRADGAHGELWRFLGVDDSHVPPNLGVRYQVRGTGRRIRARRPAARRQGHAGASARLGRAPRRRAGERPRTLADRRAPPGPAEPARPSAMEQRPHPARDRAAADALRGRRGAARAAGRAGAGRDRLTRVAVAPRRPAREPGRRVVRSPSTGRATSARR